VTETTTGTTVGILVTEWIETSLSAELLHNFLNPGPLVNVDLLVNKVISLFLHAANNGFWHPDCHSGNIMIRSNGTVCFVDMDARDIHHNPLATFGHIFHELPSFAAWKDKFVTELHKALVIYKQHKTYLLA
jgi:hypothetical protein